MAWVAGLGETLASRRGVVRESLDARIRRVEVRLVHEAMMPILVPLRQHSGHQRDLRARRAREQRYSGSRMIVLFWMVF